MAEAAGTRPVLLQVCANDHPPFADVCRYHEAAARSLGWRPLTVMLAARASRPEPAFHYLRSDFDAEVSERLDGAPLALTLCHRYRAYRTAMGSALVADPLVVVAHEFGLLRRRQRRMQRHWDRLLGRPRVTFAGVSAAVQEELDRIAGRAHLLPNGIDLARGDGERLSREAARALLGLEPAAFHVGVVGRLHPKKQPELALAGFALALQRLGDARLTFVGDGELATTLAAQARDLPVAFAGFVDQAPRCMAAFDLLLMPSGEREAFGLVALEAMAAGVVVLCGPAPGPRFVVGAAGRTFDGADPALLADALCAARRAQQGGELAEQGRQARLRVEAEFSVAAGARRLAALID